MKGINRIRYCTGIWESDKEYNSSNFKELNNVVSTLEVMKEDENGLSGVELFLFIDNSVAEGAVFKGTSTSKKLFNLVLMLKLLEIECDTKVHFCYVAGIRMIDQGTDGLSGGNLLEGVMLGQSMLSFVPLPKGSV